MKPKKQEAKQADKTISSKKQAAGKHPATPTGNGAQTDPQPAQAVSVALRIANTPQYKNAIASLPAKPYPVSPFIEALTSQYDISDLGPVKDHALGFCSALVDMMVHSKAFDACGISYEPVGLWRSMSPGFRALYEKAKEMAADHRSIVLEDSAVLKAIEGTPKGIYYDGKRIATEFNQHDKLHEVLLAGHYPQKYGKTAASPAIPAIQFNIDLGGEVVKTCAPEGYK